MLRPRTVRLAASALVVMAAAGLGHGLAWASKRTGADSGLPVPRYESIAAPEVFGRRGPGKDHRIDWVYHARGLPVRILQESDAWRRVRDPSGGEAWIHASKLSPNRTVIVAAADRPGLALREGPRAQAPVVAWLAPGVVGALKQCEGDWRKVSVPGRAEGWVLASGLWAGEDCTLPR